jgi:CTP-dependent riboflavin kinase
MQQKDVLANRAIAVLQNNQLCITELADKMCICPRHAHRILEHLKERGYKLTHHIVKRKKILSLSSDGASLCIALSIDESKAVGKALIGPDRNLRQGIEKLLLIANNNPYDL